LGPDFWKAIKEDFFVGQVRSLLFNSLCQPSSSFVITIHAFSCFGLDQDGPVCSYFYSESAAASEQNLLNIQMVWHSLALPSLTSDEFITAKYRKQYMMRFLLALDKDSQLKENI
jgi:hypothetical protein